MGNTKPNSGFTETCFDVPKGQPLWQLEVAEVTGHNLEARGRKEVNRLLQAGWRLLHIYTLTYEHKGVWRERPMAILGRPKQDSILTDASPNPPRSGQQAGKKPRTFRVVSMDAASPRRE